MSTTSSLKNVRSLLPGPFYDCLVPVFTNSGSLQPRQVVYSSCSMLYGIQLLCGKYTEGFVVCQVFFSSFWCFGLSLSMGSCTLKGYFMHIAYMK
jgi:hypothetical protein